MQLMSIWNTWIMILNIKMQIKSFWKYMNYDLKH